MLLATLAFAAAFSFAQAATPVDPNASPRTRNLLNFLAGLPNKSSDKVISGQIHLDYINTILSETGKAPGLLGEQLCGLDNWDDWGEAETRRQNLLTHWNAGGICTIYLFTGNPVSKRGARDFTRDGTHQLTLADIQSVYTEGTTPNANYKGQLDKAATHLQWLSDQGAPILLRPLWEMNLGSFGGGFWHSNWRDGGQNTQTFKNLWIYTFNYLTNTKGLHNLLWVFSPSSFNGTAAGEGDWEYAGYYPGDAYVDINGLDLYSNAWDQNQPITANECRGFGLLEALGKPTALAECGPGATVAYGPNDYRILTTAIHNLMPHCIYWMSWSVNWSMRAQDNNFVNETLNDPWVFNRTDPGFQSERDAITGDVPPTITTQPTNQTVNVGASVTFTVAAGGNPAPTYQWQRLPAGSATWENLNEGGSYHGVTSATLTVSAATAAMSGDQFRCIITNSIGSSTSAAVAFTVSGTATALLQYPASIAEDGSGNLYVADASNDTIRKITPAGVVSTLAGSAGLAGSQDGTGSNARFNQPSGLTVASNGTVYVADTGNATIRKIAADGTVTTLAGSPANRGNVDGAGASSSFSSPAGMALDAAGNLYVADAMNATVRKIAADGTVSTLAGTPGSSGDVDGTGAAARFNFPNGIAVNAGGNLCVADTYNDTIRQITPAGAVTTLAGSAGLSGSNDGTGGGALFNQPYNLAVDSSGTLYVADTGNATIRKVTAAGAVTTLAGTPGIAGLGDSAGGIVLFNQPHGLVIDDAGNIFVADTGNAAIRKIASNGTVTTLSLMPDTGGTPPAPGGGGTPPPATSSGGGGGGGAMAPWFAVALVLARMFPRAHSAAGAQSVRTTKLPAQR